MWNQQCRTGVWNRRVHLSPPKPGGWQVQVRVWPAKWQRVGFLNGSGTELIHFAVQTPTAGGVPGPIANTRQVRVLIWGGITPVCGFPNPSREVVPLISDIRSYTPRRSHLHNHHSLSCPQLYHHLRTPSVIIPPYLSMPLSTVHPKHSIYQAQLTLSTASVTNSSKFTVWVWIQVTTELHHCNWL